jgi:hypothetical protein
VLLTVAHEKGEHAEFFFTGCRDAEFGVLHAGATLPHKTKALTPLQPIL